MPSREQQDLALAELRANEGKATADEEEQLHQDVRIADAMWAGMVDAEASIVRQANRILAHNGKPLLPIPTVTTPASVAERLHRGELARLFVKDNRCLACGCSISNVFQATLMPSSFGDQLVHAPGFCGLDEDPPYIHPSGKPELFAAGRIPASREKVAA